MHVFPRPDNQYTVYTLRDRRDLTHCVGEDAALRHGPGHGEGEAQFAAVRVPVELSARIDVIVVVLDLNGVVVVALFPERISAVVRTRAEWSVCDLLLP